MSRTQFFLRIILSLSDIVRVQDSRKKKKEKDVTVGLMLLVCAVPGNNLSVTQSKHDTGWS